MKKNGIIIFFLFYSGTFGAISLWWHFAVPRRAVWAETHSVTQSKRKPTIPPQWGGGGADPGFPDPGGHFLISTNPPVDI